MKLGLTRAAAGVMAGAAGLAISTAMMAEAATTDDEVRRLKHEIVRSEIPQLRIGWHINTAYETYAQAINENKPLVLIFHVQNCGFCLRLIAKFNCPEIQRYAGRAMFGITLGAQKDGGDEGGQKLATAIDVSGFPYVAAFVPSASKVHLIGRAEGELTIPEIVKFLDIVIAGYYDEIGQIEPLHAQKMLSVQELKDAYRDRGISPYSHEECKE